MRRRNQGLGAAVCGIAGWLGPGIDPNIAIGMCDALHHRGPDSWGEWRDGDTWLGHRRLAILDLSAAGHQPMISPCRRYVLTFNGEIYNYLDLRSELERSGCTFVGSSDSEVALMACATWGVEAAIKRFEGMFAFGLYDCRDRQLWLARDPIGIKPLYYAHKGARFAFASELRALLRLPWVDTEIDRDGLFSYFRYGCVPTPATILRNVRKLQSGTLLRFDGSKLVPSRYWDLVEQAYLPRRENVSLSQAASELEKELRRSVRMHMQSDVPYGAFLSGGVDSTTIVAMMQAESSRPVRTFSIGFNEGSHDESAYAKAIAKHLGTEHNEMMIQAGDIPSLAPEISARFDEPFADNSSIPTFLVSKFARESVTVCLSGDGGDELFGGYPRYFWANRIEQLRGRLGERGANLAGGLLKTVPPQFWDAVIDPMLAYRYSGAGGLAHRVRRFADYLACPRDQSYARTMSIWADPSQALGFGATALLGADAVRYPDLSWVDEMMLVDQQNFLQDDILTKVDRASMAVSLEARVPFLTKPIIEASWRLSMKHKVSNAGDRGKLVLREILDRYVPKSLIERPKRGFGMPVGEWLRGPLREWAESLLTPTALEESGIDAKMVGDVWREHQSGIDRQTMIWTALMYRQWLQQLKQPATSCIPAA